jgi:predicted Zn-dependent peptidase
VESYTLSELDSGERVISERLSNVRSVAIGFWIGAGSRDEPDSKAGISHFIEHLLFKGSSRYTAQEIAEIFDAFGGELNAATSRENTVVYARVADEHLAAALDLISDMVFAPTFADLDAEREVVLEEIAMYEDTPQDLVHDLISEATFGGHPLGRPVIGTGDVIASLSRRSIAAYHARGYVAPNIVVAAAGNVEHDELVGLLEGAAARRTHSAAAAGAPRRPLVQAPPPGLRFQRKDTEQYHVCLGAPGISRSDRRRFAASLLDGILGGSASSRLFQEIREKRGMAYSVYTFVSQYSDAGQVGLYVGTREENVDACLEIAAAQIADVAAGNVGASELQRAKDNLKGRIVLGMESTSSRMSRLGKSVITDTELLSFERLLAEIEAVDAEAVAELAATLLAPERVSAAAIGPREEPFLAAVERVNPALSALAA